MRDEQQCTLSPLPTNNSAADWPLSKLKSVLKRQRSCQTSSPQLAMQANISKTSIKLDQKYFGSHSKVKLDDEIVNGING